MPWVEADSPRDEFCALLGATEPRQHSAAGNREHVRVIRVQLSACSTSAKLRA